MALQGTLDTFSLPDVLRLLATTGKTGCLHVDGDRGRGSVWLEEGAVVAATADRALGEATIDEVIFEIMRFSRGSFNFAVDEQPAHDRQQPKDVETVLRTAGKLLDEWRELEAVVPSLAHRVALAPELTVDQVTIDAPRWQALVAIAGGHSIGELAQALDLGELAVSRTVSDLVELGVAVVEPPSVARTPSSSGRRSTGDATGRSLTGEGPRRASVPTPPGGVTPTNGKLDGRREAPEIRERRERITTSPGAADTGRPTWRDEAKPPVETAPKPRPSKTSTSRPTRARRTGPTPTTVPPGAPPLGAPAPALNGQALSSATLTSPLSPPVSPFTTTPPPPAAAPAPMPNDRGLPPAGAPTAPVPAVPDSYRGPLLPPTLDTGPLGPSPVTHDTGQIPSLDASALPPDLTWAAEDHQHQGTHSPGPVPAPGALRSPGSRLMGTPPPPSRAVSNGRNDSNEIAGHVAAMTPAARAVIEATIGRNGGGPGGMPTAGATPEQIHSRTQLLSFLSSVRQ